MSASSCGSSTTCTTNCNWLSCSIAQLREFLAGQPFYGEAWRMMGDLWLRAGLPDSARRAYERACALDVHDDAARRQLQALS